MSKITAFLLLMTLAYAAHSQQHILVTKTSNEDRSQTLFAISSKGDSISIGNSAAFKLIAFPGSALLISATDSLHITFSDQEKKVMVNRDTYQLYPIFYARFKQDVLIRHSIMAVLNLLEDNIGDFPIRPALPLLFFNPQTERRIRSARIITTRSQADMIDTWICTYLYNKSRRLMSVSATSGEELRFNKKIRYRGKKLIGVSTYLSLETRQITDRTLTFPGKNIVKYRETIVETGKNRETQLSVTLKKSIP